MGPLRGHALLVGILDRESCTRFDDEIPMNVRLGGIPGVLMAALLTMSAPPVMAQPASAIRQGFDAAWTRQPEQRAASLRKDAANAAIEAAHRWTPEPPALEFLSKTDQLHRNEGVREYDAAIAWPLWLPGERSRVQAGAEAESSAVDARLQASRWRLAGEVRTAYWALQRAKIDDGLAMERVSNARQIAADVARRVRAGDLARADAHQADAAVAAAQSAQAQAAVAVAEATQEWLALTGAPSSSGSAEPAPPDGDGVAAHPLMAELSARRDLAATQRDLAAVQTRANPEVTLGASRERDGVDPRYSQNIVFGLRVPLGESGRGRARLASAQADWVEAESQFELEIRRRQAQLATARVRIAALRDARTAAEHRASLAQESRGFFDKSFRLGETDLPTRLRIEREAFEARREAARSRIEVDAAMSQLRQALGLLPE